jgi:Fe-S cluster assembly protein SufD
MTTGRGVATPDRELVESRAAADPDWLKERRLRAFDVYQALPMPTTKLEEWRYTDVALLSLDEVTPAEPGPRAVPQAARTLLADRTAAARVIQVGPAVAEVELDEELRRQGVILMDLAEAARAHPELVQRYLGAELPPESGKFEALNAALWTSGIFLYVPRNVQLDRPVRVVRWLDEEGAAVFPRTLIVAEPGAHLAYVEEFASPDFEAPTLSCGAVEVYAHDGAHVQYVALQRWGRGVRHFSSQRTIAQRDADLDTLVVNLGATVARVDLKASLEGPGARSDMLGLYFGRDDQHFDHNTRQDHVAPNANSDLLYKGALYDRAHGVFRGIIRVHRGAQRTDAYQTNRSLLLSPDARAESLPNLEIEADDVRCSHGATVSQLDEEELFYLMSRGLRRRQAERLVVFGFFGEVLDRLPLREVAAELRVAIEAQIR